jgi:hypothetical protein
MTHLGYSVSEVVSEFGRSFTNQLPDDMTQAELNDAMTIVVTAWNAVTLDKWEQNNEFEQHALASVAQEPVLLLQLKRLIKRKKKKFSQYDWSIGNHWVRADKKGDLIFGCEARRKSEH